MTTPTQIKPTQGAVGLSHEYIFDIAPFKPGTTPESSDWLNIPDFKDFNPAAPAKKVNVTTYAHGGNSAEQKSGEDWTAQFNVLGIKDNVGEFQEELLALIEAGDAKLEKNIVNYRYYHHTSAVIAYQGTAAVEWSRQNTGPEAETEFFSITLTGQGDRRKITNPALDEAGGGE